MRKDIFHSLEILRIYFATAPEIELIYSVFRPVSSQLPNDSLILS